MCCDRVSLRRARFACFEFLFLWNFLLGRVLIYLYNKSKINQYPTLFFGNTFFLMEFSIRSGIDLLWLIVNQEPALGFCHTIFIWVATFQLKWHSQYYTSIDRVKITNYEATHSKWTLLYMFLQETFRLKSGIDLQKKPDDDEACRRSESRMYNATTGHIHNKGTHPGVQGVTAGLQGVTARLQGVPAGIARCTCGNCKAYLRELQGVPAGIARCTCGNCKVYLRELQGVTAGIARCNCGNCKV